jgi:hypothetical protein
MFKCGTLLDWLANRFGEEGRPVEALTLAEVALGPRRLGRHRGPRRAVVGRFSIAFTLPGDEPARLEVVDVTGRRVLARALDGIGPGRHIADLSGQSGLRPGIYLVRLFYGSRSQTRRVVTLM